MKKTIALLLVFIYSFVFFCGCDNSLDTSSLLSSDYTQNDKSAAKTIRLLYSSKDSLDPFTCVTEQNADLSQLIFDPLLIVNNQYEIEYRLAKNVEVSGNTCTVELINAKFSDGSSVTPMMLFFLSIKLKNQKQLAILLR